jgi:hypothetical protein
MPLSVLGVLLSEGLSALSRDLALPELPADGHMPSEIFLTPSAGGLPSEGH